MACPCCGPNCKFCNSVTKEAGPDYIQTNDRQDPCRSQTISDFYLPCNRGGLSSFNPRYEKCSTIAGVPSEYSDCTCMKFDQTCGTSDYAVGVDDNGACCTVIRTTTYYTFFVFVFLAGPCKWIRVLKSTYGSDTYCFGDPLAAGGCSAECPAPRECPNFCSGPYDGCTCNEFP